MSNDGFPMIYAFVVDSHSLICGCFKSPYTLRMLFHIQFPIESFCPLYTSPITSKWSPHKKGGVYVQKTQSLSDKIHRNLSDTSPCLQAQDGPCRSWSSWESFQSLQPWWGRFATTWDPWKSTLLGVFYLKKWVFSQKNMNSTGKTD